MRWEGRVMTQTLPPSSADPTPTPSLERLDDVQAYRVLLDLSAHMNALFQQCWSTSAATAFSSGSRVITQIASWLYLRNEASWQR